MPELPEVETVKRGLLRLIVGKRIVNVEVFNPGSFQVAPIESSAHAVGALILGVRRRAKVLIIDLSSGYSLVIHLKMTGQIVFRGNENFGAGHPNDSLIATLPDRSTRVGFSLSAGSKVFFNDQRKFGWIRLYPTLEVPNIDFMRRVGPEPFDADLTGQKLYERLQRRANTSIKAALLDQSVLAGVGNIYADESLWAAKLHPARKVKDVSREEVNCLLKELRAILHEAIERGGSTDRNYVDAEGRKGSYLAFARVFRREGQPCVRCGSTIEKIRVAGRGTHICPVCQIIK